MAEELTERQITCPYCKSEDLDSWEHRQDSDENYECSNCDKKFRWYREIEVEYKSVPDCELNEEEHEYPEFDKVLETSRDGKVHYFRCRRCIKCDKFDSITTDADGIENKD